MVDYRVLFYAEEETSILTLYRDYKMILGLEVICAYYDRPGCTYQFRALGVGLGSYLSRGFSVVAVI